MGSRLLCARIDEEGVMKNPFLRSAVAVAGGIIGFTLHGVAWSQPYPQRPIRLVVQGVASSAPDIITRPIAQRVSQSVGQPVIVDNRPGAAGMVAAQIAVSAAPDGYTLLVASSGTISIAPFLMKKQPYDPLTDLVAVTLIAVAPLIVSVHPSVPVASVKDLITLAKSRPNKVLIGTPGVGTVQHLTVEMFNHAAGVSLGHVPYKGGGAAVIDTVGGQIQLAITAIPAVLSHIHASRLRALGVSSAKRSSAVPSVPTIAESGLPGFEAVTWYAMYAPRNTPPKIIEKLYTETHKATEAPDVRSAAAQQGVDLEVKGPLALAEFQRIDMAKWQRTIRESNIVLE
jgi:tripartite-type tricarboxylate transporter receptor subunit TctC